MNMYLFKSERLGFRTWKETDIEPMYKISSNKDVMRYFPSVLNKDHTIEFVHAMQVEQTARGYCYFAVDLLESASFIGFIGLKYQTYSTDFNPSVDIGWRLSKKYWNQGFATEGAKRCVKYGLSDLKLSKINAVAPELNKPSIAVMKKIGMHFIKTFKHPSLKEHPLLERCVLYELRS